MKKGYVRKIIKFSSIDGPGNRTVVFLQGCNFNCSFCHNPETIKIFNNLNDETTEVKLMSIYEIADTIDEHRDFIEGITISGGECTLQFDFLLSLVMELKRRKYQVIIDTNGSLEISKFQQILHYVDEIIFDFKVFGEKEHKKITGQSNRKVKRNIKIAGLNQQIYEIRTVIIPDLIDDFENVKEISNFIAQIDKTIQLKLITYRQLGVREDLLQSKSPSKKYMLRLKSVAQAQGLEHVILN